MEIRATLRLEDGGGKHFEIGIPFTPDGQPILPAENTHLRVSERDYIVHGHWWNYKADGDIDIVVIAIMKSTPLITRPTREY